MHRISPAFPDLLPFAHRLGAASARPFDPVEMRLGGRTGRVSERADASVPRRPLRVLVHASSAQALCAPIADLLAAGCGIVVVLDDHLDPGCFPQTALPAQVVALEPWLPPIWGGSEPGALEAWAKRGALTGVLLALAPAPDAHEQVAAAIGDAARRGAGFAVALPLSIPAEDRHRVYDELAGEAGNAELEDLLFHTDLGQLALELEREATRACRRLGLREGLPGPATVTSDAAAFAAAADLLLWARRLDQLDGVSSTGWQLRRAAQALLASGRSPATLLAEDNLRVVPGFSPWVEAFARSLWAGCGEPFEEALGRWVTG